MLQADFLWGMNIKIRMNSSPLFEESLKTINFKIKVLNKIITNNQHNRITIRIFYYFIKKFCVYSNKKLILFLIL